MPGYSGKVPAGTREDSSRSNIFFPRSPSLDSSAPAGELTHLLTDPGMARKLMPGYSGIVPAGTREGHILLVGPIANNEEPINKDSVAYLGAK